MRRVSVTVCVAVFWTRALWLTFVLLLPVLYYLLPAVRGPGVPTSGPERAAYQQSIRGGSLWTAWFCGSVLLAGVVLGGARKLWTILNGVSGRARLSDSEVCEGRIRALYELEDGTIHAETLGGGQRLEEFREYTRHPELVFFDGVPGGIQVDEQGRLSSRNPIAALASAVPFGLLIAVVGALSGQLFVG
ncbi:MAG: hypothetical protein HY319_15140 [Armatimonadetes bacterium]|nr:hypothetical protein [Armatimonadota bacterium]